MAGFAQQHVLFKCFLRGKNDSIKTNKNYKDNDILSAM